jgi:hypothetical protein
MYKSKYSHARSADLLSHWKSESKITFKIFEPASASHDHEPTACEW